MFACLLVVVVLTVAVGDCDETFVNPVVFPFGGPFMGIFVAIAVPLEAPLTDVFVSYNFEANYNLPENASDYELVPTVARSLRITRRHVYDALEFKLDAHGHDGKSCLLRTICEAAATHRSRDDGVLGDIFHLVLTPSSSSAEGDLSADYAAAEGDGRTRGRCGKYARKCRFSVLALISRILPQ